MNETSFVEPHNRKIPIGGNGEGETKKLKTGSRVINFLFCFGLYLTLIQQLPLIREVAYEEIRLLLYSLFVSLSVYGFIRLQYGTMSEFTKSFLFSALTSISLFLFLNIMNDGAQLVESYNDVIEFLIPFGILIVSGSLEYNRKQIMVIVLYYCMFSTVLGVLLVYYYGGSWIISSRYFLEAKNQIGPIMAISFISSLLWFIKGKEYGRFYQIMAICCSICLLLVLLAIRSRSALLAVLIIVFSMLVYYFFSKKNVCSHMLVFVTILLLIIVGISGKGQSLIKPVYDAFTLNYEVSDIESISAGRINVYKDSINYIANNLLWGDSFNHIKYDAIPHNYLLNKIVKYGIVGSLPLILFYLYLWSFLFRKIFLYSKISIEIAILAPLVMMIPMIISLFEYSAPYGPGVSQVMAWFLLGQYLREEQTALVKKL